MAFIDGDKALKRIKELQETAPLTVGKKQFAEGFFCGLDEAEVVLMQAPAVDVAEVKHGEWEEIRNAYGEIEGWLCKCGREVKSKENYCPACGAKMDGKI